MTDIERDAEKGEKQPLLDKTTARSADSIATSSPRSGIMTGYKAAEEKVSSFCCGCFRNNSTFRENFELALRGAFFAIPIAFPFFVPWSALGLPDITHSTDTRRAYFSNTAVIIYVFTLYKTLGETICFAVAGMLGTTLAVLNVWCMFGLMPLGVTPDCSVWIHVIGWVWGLLFTFMILWLNFDILAKMFALSWHMYFWMTFLNPANHDFTHSFGMRLDGPAFKALTMSALGCFVAILAACLPYPILALNKAKGTSKLLAAVLKDSWNCAVECYAGQQRDLLQEDRLKQDMDRLSRDVLSLSAHIENAWWECFGFGRSQRARVNLKYLEKALHESYNRLGTLMYSCKMENYDSAHLQMMGIFKTYLDDVCKETGELFDLATTLAGHGYLSQDDISKLSEQSDATKRAVEALSKIFKQRQTSVVGTDNVDEFAFCLSVCAYGILAIDYATHLIHNNDKVVRERPMLLTTFDPKVIMAKSNWQWVFRNGCSIVLSFVIGFFGYSKMIKNYNSSPAETVSLLLSTFVGSQMNKSMGRVQGVVLGCVFGQMAYALFAWCAWWGYLVIAVVTILWLLGTLFMYYNSAEFGYIGCLMAAFGTKYMLQGCSNEVFMPTESYYIIINTVVGITLMTVFDLTLSPKSSSQLAVHAMLDAWNMYKKAMEDLFDPSVKNVPFSHDIILTKLAEASKFGDEAKKEPRWHRMPWRGNLFDHAIKSCFRIRLHLCVMEYGAAVDGKDGNPKAFTIKKLKRMEAFHKVKEDMDAKIGQLTMLCSIFSYDIEGDPFANMDLKKMSQSRALEHQHLADLLKEVSENLGEEALIHSNRDAKINTLTDVMMCTLCSLVNALDGQLAEISHLKHQILSSSI